jgi:heme/copper-type cytochrome/quinol oxidase subunit 2
MNSLLFKACVTGLVFIVLGLIMGMVFKGLKPTLSTDCDKWDENYVMEISLFAAGFIFRYALQVPAFSSFVL